MRYLDGFDEVDHHVDQTVKVYRNEDPLQQVTQLTHGAAQGRSLKNTGEKKPRCLVEVSGKQTKKSPLQAGDTFFGMAAPSNDGPYFVF